MRPILKFGSESLVHQQAGKSAAVDEQISLHRLPRFQHQLGDVTGFGLADLGYFALDPGNAILLREPTKVLRIACGVDMVGVAQPILLQQAELVCFRGH